MVEEASAEPATAVAGREYPPYCPGLIHRGAAEAPFLHRHLLGIEGLSPDDISHVLGLADGYVELNRQAGKKVNTSLTLRVPEGSRASPLLRSGR